MESALRCQNQQEYDIEVLKSSLHFATLFGPMKTTEQASEFRSLIIKEYLKFYKNFVADPKSEQEINRNFTVNTSLRWLYPN